MLSPQDFDARFATGSLSRKDETMDRDRWMSRIRAGCVAATLFELLGGVAVAQGDAARSHPAAVTTSSSYAPGPAALAASGCALGWSAVGDGVGGYVFALAVWDDGTGGGPALFAGGDF